MLLQKVQPDLCGISTCTLQIYLKNNNGSLLFKRPVGHLNDESEWQDHESCPWKAGNVPKFCRNRNRCYSYTLFDLPRSHTRQWRCKKVSEIPGHSFFPPVNQLTLSFTHCQESSNQKLINPWGIAKLKKTVRIDVDPPHRQMNRFKSTCFAFTKSKRDMEEHTWTNNWHDLALLLYMYPYKYQANSKQKMRNTCFHGHEIQRF